MVAQRRLAGTDRGVGSRGTQRDRSPDGADRGREAVSDERDRVRQSKLATVAWRACGWLSRVHGRARTPPYGIG
jgi:hypothetical protein